MTYTNRQAVDTKFVEILSDTLKYLPDNYIAEMIEDDKVFDDLGSDELDNTIILLDCEEIFCIELDLYGEELTYCSLKDFLEAIYSEMSL